MFPTSLDTTVGHIRGQAFITWVVGRVTIAEGMKLSGECLQGVKSSIEQVWRKSTNDDLCKCTQIKYCNFSLLQLSCYCKTSTLCTLKMLQKTLTKLNSATFQTKIKRA